MRGVKSRPYTKHVFKQAPSGAPTDYHKYWGGIGDIMYFLSFTTPELDARPGFRHVLAADVYHRYSGDPIGDLVKAHGKFHELWTHARKGAGPRAMPAAVLNIVRKPTPNVQVLTPGIYYDSMSAGWHNHCPYNLPVLRQIARSGPMYVTPDPGREAVVAKYPFVASRPFVTIQPRTGGKVPPVTLTWEILDPIFANADVTFAVVLSTRGAVSFDVARVASRPNVHAVVGNSIVDAINLVRHADAHIGTESCLAMASMLLKRPTLVFKSFGLGHFSNDIDFYPNEYDQQCNPAQVVEGLRRCLS